jgi:hypothetical protein
MFMTSLFYLDTSGLNFFADNIKDFDGFSLLKKHLGFELYLSPITLWEVLLNSDESRRDYLVYWAQFNCAPELVKSPSEIIIQYILAGCPSKDRKAFFDEPHTKLDMGKSWTSIHKKIEYNLPVDFEELKKRTKPMRDLSKKLKSIITGMCDEETENYKQDPFHIAMQVTLTKLEIDKVPSKENERIYKIALIFLFFTICIGFELQTNVVRDYWENKDIDEPLERLDYLLENHPKLMVRGPILEMAIMANVQISMENCKSRGMFHDCFHSIYCYYSHNFITGDAHFASLKGNYDHHSFEGIIMTDQIIELWTLANEKLTRHIKGQEAVG